MVDQQVSPVLEVLEESFLSVEVEVVERRSESVCRVALSPPDIAVDLSTQPLAAHCLLILAASPVPELVPWVPACLACLPVPELVQPLHLAL